jgi:hypothetical protein
VRALGLLALALLAALATIVADWQRRIRELERAASR